MDNQRPVFLVGGALGNGGSGGDVGVAIAELGLKVRQFSDASALRAALEETEPLALFAPAGGSLFGEVCLALRSHARFARVPAFGVAAHPTDLTFIDLFQAGGDDVLPADRTAVLRRLRPLVTKVGDPPSRREGTAIVAGADRVWRAILGRTLFNGGLSVRFVDDLSATLTEGAAAGVKLVVVADEDGEAAVALARKARAAGHAAAWIAVVPPRRIGAISEALRDLERTSVTDAYAPPENVLFLANELMRPRGTDNRRSARVLFGTRVSFRVAGRESDEVGFTYNVSEGGLYVRTAAPVEPGEEVWLELWPPRSERRVRLAGRVAWRRHLGPNDFATVPAGFGVELTEGLAGDLERWRSGYRAFAGQAFGPGGRP